MSYTHFQRVYVPRVGSQIQVPVGLRCSKKDERNPQEFVIELTSPCTGSLGKKELNESKNSKVERLQRRKSILTAYSRLTWEDESPTLCQQKNKIRKTAVSQGEKSNSNSNCLNEDDVFTFTQKLESKKTAKEREKAHQAEVLQTISKMLNQNRHIRQRLASLCPTCCD